MRLNRYLFFANKLQNAALCKESFVFTSLANKNIQRFRNALVHEFYGLKASQMSKVHASSHKHPHVEKIKNLRQQNFKREAKNKQLEDTQRSEFSS